MKNVLPTSTVENRNPLYKIENGFIISKYADVTIPFIVELPEIFTLTQEEYVSIHAVFTKAVKILPDYTVVHKQDWFIKEIYTPKHESSDFLAKAHEMHFIERPYLSHKCYLFITKTNRNNARKMSLFTTLCRGRLVPREMLSKEEINSFKEVVEQFVSILKDSTYFKIKRLTEEEIIGMDAMSGLLDNYITLDGTAEKTSLKDIQFNPENIVVGDKKVCVHTLSDIDDLPLVVSPDCKYEKLSTDKSNCVLSYAAPVGLLLPCNHIYNQYIMIDNHQENIRKLESQSKRMFSLSRLSRSNMVNHEQIETFLNAIHEGGFLTVRAHFNVIAWADTDAELGRVRNDVGSQITAMNCEPRHNVVDAPVLFWAGIPGNGADFPSEDTFMTFLDVATCFLTYETCQRDSLSPFGIKLTDRYTGKPLHVDISDAPMKKGIITNRNKFILGPTGSGKSFFTNHIMRQYYEQNSHIVLVDTGNSYLGLCQLINKKTSGKDGIYLTYTEENPITFNPFYTDDGVFDIEKKESIKALILALWKKDSETSSRAEDVNLSNAVNGYLELIKRASSVVPCFNTFYEYIRTTYRKIVVEKKIKDKDFDIDNFLNVLEPYYKGGEYDYLLNSDKQLDLLNKRFVIFELDNIKDHKILFPVVTIIIMETFINKMRRLKGIRKVILIEEAWKAIAKEGMAEYIKYLFKTVRKFFGEAIIVTQEVEDIIHSNIVRQSIINNSDCKILCDQRKYMNRFEDIQALLGLTEKQKAQVLSLNQNLDPHRIYREVYIDLNGAHTAVYGVEVSPEAYLAYSTEETEKTALFNLANERYNGDLEMAIKDMVQEQKI
ncbi:MAG: TraG family conjugative transposon ATPase, partial [Bacteroidales bacterium]|nr:TraG family conjugative transposon ATPase [Bacteroidales bacterium]